MSIELDSDSNVIEEFFAVIYAPKRSRGRFPENCVKIVATEEAAREHILPEKHQYAAKVVGPSRSSEGLRLYYLVSWLD